MAETGYKELRAFWAAGAATAPMLAPRFVLWRCRRTEPTCCGLRMGRYATDEIPLAEDVVPALRKGMLCQADRFFPSYELWRRAARIGADRSGARARTRDLTWIGACRMVLDRSCMCASTSDRRNQRKGIVVRVIDYRRKDVQGAEPICRWITTILDPAPAPAKELAALFHERWEIENRSGRTQNASARRPDRAAQQDAIVDRAGVLGPALRHPRGRMHEAALKAEEDPDRLSWLRSVRVVQRRIARSRYSPLGRGDSCMKRSGWRFFKSGSSPAETGSTSGE